MKRQSSWKRQDYTHEWIRITYKLCLTTWKTLHTSQPLYPSELISHYTFHPDPCVLPIQISVSDQPVLLATFPLGPFLCLRLLLGTLYLHTVVLSIPEKVAHTRLPSVGSRNWSRFLAVSLQVTWIINPTVGCHYFSPGPQLPPQPLRGLLPVSLLGEQMHDGCEQFA